MPEERKKEHKSATTTAIYCTALKALHRRRSLTLNWPSHPPYIPAVPPPMGSGRAAVSPHPGWQQIS